MQPKVVCYVPVTNGTVLNEHAWGVADVAQKINTEQLPLVGIVVHAGLEIDQITSLPFHEVYHIKLEPEQWRTSEYHIEAFQQVAQSIRIVNGIFIFCSNPLYDEVAVRLSIRHGAGVITNGVDVRRENKPGSSLTVKREIYREKAHEFVTFNSFKPLNHQFITMSTSILFGKKQQGRPQLVKELHLNKEKENKVKFLSESIINWSELKITEARCVIGIGRGVSGAESLNDIYQLAELLNAPIGGSKVADELGLTPRDKRIGSSGSAIDADIYVAIGISGSSQHLDGIKGVKRVIAINNDPSAPIFQRSDIGVVGRFEDVIPKLVQSLQSERYVSDP